MNQNETGRSMVEMLGVLAIMGVLTVGGVAGYRYAVDKMDANEIVDELIKRAITASQQRVLGRTINLSEYGNNGSIKGVYGVTPTDNYNGNGSQFALGIQNVPQRVCDMILNFDWALPREIKVGGIVVTEDTTCIEGNNDMTFAFNNDLGSGTTSGGENEPELEPCAEDEYRTLNGECVYDPHPECNNGEFYNSMEGQCMTCPNENNTIVEINSSTLEDTCEKCTNAYSAQFYCVYCPTGIACGQTCCGEGQQCKVDGSSWPYTYTCVDGLGENECLTNADCDKLYEKGTYYCQNNENCTLSVGTCQPIGGTTTINIQGISYTGKNTPMSWYAAKNFCEALGLSMVPVSNFCSDEEISKLKKYEEAVLASCNTGNIKNFWTGTKEKSCVAFAACHGGGILLSSFDATNRTPLCVKK